MKSLPVLVLLVMLVQNARIYSQTTAQAPTSSELASSDLDTVLEKATGNELLIVVSRLGRRESKSDLNRRRLQSGGLSFLISRKDSIHRAPE
jgi:hypothetical protein